MLKVISQDVAVDPVRAAEAFAAGLAAIDAVEREFAEQIRAAQDELAEKNRVRAELHKKEMEKWREEAEIRIKASARYNELREKKNSFWGLSTGEEIEYQKVYRDSMRYTPNPMGSAIAYRVDEDVTFVIADLKSTVERQLAQASVAMNCAYLEPQWAQAVYFIEKDALAWARTRYPFSKYAKQEEGHA